jgi:hypothetical protein
MDGRGSETAAVTGRRRATAAPRASGPRWDPNRWCGRREVLAAQARERLRVLAELADLLRDNPFLETSP